MDHSRALLGSFSVIFYDMNSFYFEDEDDLRRIGFSQDGKFQNPRSCSPASTATR